MYGLKDLHISEYVKVGAGGFAPLFKQNLMRHASIQGVFSLVHSVSVLDST